MGFVYMGRLRQACMYVYIGLTDSKVPHAHVYEETHLAHKC